MAPAAGLCVTWQLFGSFVRGLSASLCFIPFIRPAYIAGKRAVFKKLHFDFALSAYCPTFLVVNCLSVRESEMSVVRACRAVQRAPFMSEEGIEKEESGFKISWKSVDWIVIIGWT